MRRVTDFPGPAPLAHDFLIDNETNVKYLFDHEGHLVPAEARDAVPSHWKTVRLTAVAQEEIDQDLR